jgi:hypothetical protein
VLSGFLECGECGGGFHALNGEGCYGCGWHRDRGQDVCASVLTVPRVALEERVFGAIRERILVPEVVVYAVDVEQLRPRIEARVLEMREAFAGAPEVRRGAFRALLGERRLRVLADPAQRFRVEGLFELTVETADARAYEGTGRLL